MSRKAKCKMTKKQKDDLRGDEFSSDSQDDDGVDVQTDTPAGSIADSVARVLVVAGEHVRERAFAIVGVGNCQQIARSVERRLNARLKREEKRAEVKADAGSVLAQRQALEDAKKLVQSSIEKELQKQIHGHAGVRQTALLKISPAPPQPEDDDFVSFSADDMSFVGTLPQQQRPSATDDNMGEKELPFRCGSSSIIHSRRDAGETGEELPSDCYSSFPEDGKMFSGSSDDEDSGARKLATDRGDGELEGGKSDDDEELGSTPPPLRKGSQSISFDDEIWSP